MTATPIRRVTLIAPGLLDCCIDPETRISTPLGSMLARADPSPLTSTGAETRLFFLFGIAPEPEHDLPVAAVTRLVDMGVVDSDWWVRADPVHLEPRRDGLVLHPYLDLSQDEADALVAELNEALAQDGWTIRAPRPQRWYLRQAEVSRIETTPLSAVIGRDVHPFLPRGADRRSWHTRLNEIQILLHTSAVNARREASSKLPANSVWFWGGGTLPRRGACDWTKVWSNEPLAQGLARLSEISSASLPEDADTWLQHADTSGSHLIVFESLAARGPTGNEGDECGRIWQEWLAPLRRAVHRGQISELTLLGDAGPAFHYRRPHRWRFWRRRLEPTLLGAAA